MRAEITNKRIEEEIETDEINSIENLQKQYKQRCDTDEKHIEYLRQRFDKIKTNRRIREVDEMMECTFNNYHSARVRSITSKYEKNRKMMDHSLLNQRQEIEKYKLTRLLNNKKFLNYVEETHVTSNIKYHKDKVSNTLNYRQQDVINCMHLLFHYPLGRRFATAVRDGSAGAIQKTGFLTKVKRPISHDDEAKAKYENTICTFFCDSKKTRLLTSGYIHRISKGDKYAPTSIQEKTEKNIASYAKCTNFS